MPITFTIGDREEVVFNLGNVAIGDRLPYYEGPTTITPRIYQQMLETDGYSMTDDIVCEEIPLARITNPSGGVTAIIG